MARAWPRSSSVLTSLYPRMHWMKFTECCLSAELCLPFGQVARKSSPIRGLTPSTFLPVSTMRTAVHAQTVTCPQFRCRKLAMKCTKLGLSPSGAGFAACHAARVAPESLRVANTQRSAAHPTPPWRRSRQRLGMKVSTSLMARRPSEAIISVLGPQTWFVCPSVASFAARRTLFVARRYPLIFSRKYPKILRSPWSPGLETPDTQKSRHIAASAAPAAASTVPPAAPMTPKVLPESAQKTANRF